MVFTSECGGRGAHYNREGYNCNQCEVHSSRLFEEEASTVRTLSRIYSLAHCFDPSNPLPFTCPGCKKFFGSQTELETEIAPANESSYADSHFGQMWHCPPLLHIEPMKFILCTLHLLLSCTKLLVKQCILPMLVTDETASRFNAQLKHLNICVPKQTKRGSTSSTDQARRVKFTGAECVTLLEHWDGIVDDLVQGAPDKAAASELATKTYIIICTV